MPAAAKSKVEAPRVKPPAVAAPSAAPPAKIDAPVQRSVVALARAAGSVAENGHGLGAASRARTMGGLQHSLGNARLNRMLSPVSAAAPAAMATVSGPSNQAVQAQLHGGTTLGKSNLGAADTGGSGQASVAPGGAAPGAQAENLYNLDLVVENSVKRYAGLSEAEAVQVLTHVYRQLEGLLDTYRGWHAELQANRKEHWVVGFWADTFGGVELPDIDMWNEIGGGPLYEARMILQESEENLQLRWAVERQLRQQTKGSWLEAYYSLPQGRIQRSAYLLQQAADRLETGRKLVQQYMEGTIRGAERGVTGVRIAIVALEAGVGDVDTDQICEIQKELHLLPSQNGGSWSWSGPYGPGPRLLGPLNVYRKNPGIPSSAQCRGACGPDCDTCEPTPAYRYTDPASGETWEYRNFEDCNSNVGCREHDAAFDWAADKHGETGRAAIIMPWHMAANIECTCNNPVGNCIAWIRGLPPFDSKIYFADAATRTAPGGGGGLGGTKPLTPHVGPVPVVPPGGGGPVSPPGPPSVGPTGDPCSEAAMDAKIGSRTVEQVVKQSKLGDKINRKPVKPNQDMVTRKGRGSVCEFASRACYGSPFPAIDLYPGKNYTVIDEGHHRFVASRLIEKPVAVSGRHRPPPEPYDPDRENFPNPFEWSEVEWT
jgi:hypothetical protein